jgi:uncharacterized protein YjbJ (UPF0337 family)
MFQFLVLTFSSRARIQRFRASDPEIWEGFGTCTGEEHLQVDGAAACRGGGARRRCGAASGPARRAAWSCNLSGKQTIELQPDHGCR